MVKLTVLFGQPKDPAEFERYYLDRHVPEYVESGKLAHLVRVDMGKGLPRGGQPPAFYRTADLWWDSMEALVADAQSPAGQEALGDLENFATGGYQLLRSEVETREIVRS